MKTKTTMATTTTSTTKKTTTNNIQKSPLIGGFFRILAKPKLEKMCIETKRDIKISIVEGKYKCISAYGIPKDVEDWLPCPNCELRPLTWEFNNGSSTACGCGENEYTHFSIHAESIMSFVSRNNGSALHYPRRLRDNWNHWVNTGEEREPHSFLRENGRW